jgi:hypothetical protein
VLRQHKIFQHRQDFNTRAILTTRILSVLCSKKFLITVFVYLCISDTRCHMWLRDKLVTHTKFHTLLSNSESRCNWKTHLSLPYKSFRISGQVQTTAPNSHLCLKCIELYLVSTPILFTFIL